MGQALLLIVALALLLIGAASSTTHPYTKSSLVPVLKRAVNQKGFETYHVQSTLINPFTSIQHCLPINFLVKAAADDVTPFAVVEVNTTSLQGSYNIHTYVQNKQLASRLPLIALTCPAQVCHPCVNQKWQ